MVGVLAVATGANAEMPAPFGHVFQRNDAAHLFMIADVATQAQSHFLHHKAPVRTVRPRRGMKVIRPPMGGPMPVIPPPTGATTPVIPPPK